MVKAWQRPAKKALNEASKLSNTTVLTGMFCALNQSATFFSLVVPDWVQMVAFLSCLALVTLIFFGTRKPWPS